MDYLTEKEVAELKSCKPQYIRKLISDGKIKAEKQFNQEIKQTCYMVPVSSLPEDLQAKYYKKLKGNVELSPELKEPSALKQPENTVKKRFE